jgi:hypothetical protein
VTVKETQKNEDVLKEVAELLATDIFDKAQC